MKLQEIVSYPNSRLICLFTLIALFISVDVVAQDAPTRAQRQQVRRIGSTIERAGRLFQNQKFEESAELIKEVQESIEEQTEDVSKAVIDLYAPEYEKLKLAHQLLTEAGQTMPPLRPLPAGKVETPDGEVSFTGEIAGMLNSKCGRCHVQGRRGNFNMVSFQALMGGMDAPVVIPGKPEESRLVEIIESGEMPQGGGTVTDMELERLKQWITEGAKYDAPDTTISLAVLGGNNNNNNTPEPDEPEMEVVRATGRETISFATDVAPVIVANCGGCHFEPQNVRGGLNVTTFRQFLNGGDSGRIVTPGDGDGSILVQRLRGENNLRIMPQGRPRLPKEVIDKVAKWIDEGARFDGRAPTLNLRTVANIARAERATHEELSRDRESLAMRNWKTTMGDIESTKVQGDDFLIVGSTKNDILDEVQALAESLVPEIKAKLRIDRKEPLVKGQISLFVFDSRYDYSEFGKMVEQRELPRAWKSHWGYDTVSAYGAVLANTPEKLAEMESDFTQRIAAVSVASLGTEVPEWFANGYGYVIAKDIIKDKDAAEAWEQQSAAAAQSMQRPTDFMQGRMADDEAALVAFGFVNNLMQNRAQFTRLLKEMREQPSFDDAFRAVYSVGPVELVNQIYGQGNNRRNRRGR